MKPERSYLVCATPRSGSTLVCKALSETGVAGRPEEYFEALRRSGRPAPPRGVLRRRRRPLDLRPARRARGRPTTRRRARPGAGPPTTATSSGRWRPGRRRTASSRAKLMWHYLGDFVGLLRNVPEYRDLPLAELLPAVFPDADLRPRRPRQQDPPGGVAVEGGADGELAPGGAHRGSVATRDDPALPDVPRGAPAAASLPLPRDRAPARADPARGGELGRLLRALRDQADARPLRELRRRLRDSTLNILERLGSTRRPTSRFEPRMKRQSDGRQRRLGAPLQRAAARNRVRPGAGGAGAGGERSRAGIGGTLRVVAFIFPKGTRAAERRAPGQPQGSPLADGGNRSARKDRRVSTNDTYGVESRRSAEERRSD